MDGGNAINKILFLKVRAMKKDAATLVASGPQGNVPGGCTCEFLVGVCRLVLQILALFQTQNVIFQVRFQTRARLLKNKKKSHQWQTFEPQQKPKHKIQLVAGQYLRMYLFL